MLATLRSDRRTRRNMIINTEYLDERIVLSAASAGVVAEANVAAVVSSSHARSAEKTAVVVEHHHGHSARHALKLERHASQHQFTPSSTVTPIVIGSPGSINPAVVSHSAMIAVNPPSTTMSTASQTTSAPSPQRTRPPRPPPRRPPQTHASSSLPANVSAPLQSLYQQYEAFETSGGSGTFSPTGLNGVEINGTNVGINVYTSDSSSFNTLLSQLQSDGLQVTNDRPPMAPSTGRSRSHNSLRSRKSRRISVSRRSYQPML